jgi:hypothetical protein
MTESADSATPDLAPPCLQRPSFCAAEPAALKRWLEKLPRSNLGDSATRLYAAINELNHCHLGARQRFELLEALRPVVHAICESLSLYLRKQPIVMAPTAYKVSQLTQRIQLELALGYEKVRSMPTAQRSDGRLLMRNSGRHQKKQLELIAKATHRALNERIRCLFRCQLMYTDSSADLWRQMHKLYHEAVQQQLQHRAFEDRVAGQTCLISVEQCYIKALLLGAVHANQLRQEDLLQVFEYMPEWVTLAELVPYESPNEDLLVIDLDSGNPPKFMGCITPPNDPAQWRVLLVDKLLYHLGEQLANESHNTLSDNLIKHLLLSWGSNTTRTFMRMESHDTLSICVGLSSLHFFSANEIQYQDFINGTSDQALLNETIDKPSLSPPLPPQPSHDKSEQAVDHGASSTKQSVADKIQPTRHEHAHRNYEVCTTNISPGGYQLSWPEQALTQVDNGDILGLRESEQSHWGIGLVSWLRRCEGQPTQLGIKLLGPSAQPFGARKLNHQSDANEAMTEYQRVLFLPAIVPVNQAASLITPAHLFQENTNLVLTQHGRQMHIQLTRLLAATGSVNHFEVEVLSEPWSSIQQDLNDIGDSLTTGWPDL